MNSFGGLQIKNLQMLTRTIPENHFREIVKVALHARGKDQQHLFAYARSIRLIGFPDRLAEIRSVIEISNICKQRCNYCNIGYEEIKKYVISADNLVKIVTFLYHKQKRRVILLQSGENQDDRFVADVIRASGRIKDKMPDIQLIVCIGNLSYAMYRDFWLAGVDRYLLKIEASRPSLYESVKPNDRWIERRRCLDDLMTIGFKVGSGIIVGLPGQSIDDLTADLEFLSKLNLDMVSASVFIPGKNTFYEKSAPGDVETTLNFMALLRITNPFALIPTTSSLEKLKNDGQYLGLMAGANTVTIHDGTPKDLEHLFPIYDQQRFKPNNNHLFEIVDRAGLRFPDTSFSRCE
ncbi:hypothetical protein CKO09_02785 [Chromatium weissei]|nr:hypothetical protein [Chromatium weissei]